MNILGKICIGLGSISASVHNGVEDLPTSLKNGAVDSKSTIAKYGSLVKQGYNAGRQLRAKQLELEGTSNG